jgi:hypothetical protein
MTASEQNKSPDFFDDPVLDPLAVATGRRIPPAMRRVKKKAGFYLSETLLERFNRRYHQLKLEGAAVENKSALLESALAFALDDLDRGVQSRLAPTLK